MLNDYNSTEKLSRPVLVLNSGFIPIGIESVEAVLIKLFTERAKVVDDEYRTFTLDQWIEHSSITIESDLTIEEKDIIHSPSLALLIPRVVFTPEYNVSPRRLIRFRRSDLFTRDHFTCQYCGVNFGREHLTVDHVHPRSKGGSTCWENCVTSCRPCNTRKADRTPTEAGMNLINGMPRKPSVDLTFTRKLESETLWQKFIG